MVQEENEDSEALMRVAMWCFGEIGVPGITDMKLVDEIERLMNEWFTTDRTRAVAMTALLKISGRSDIEKDEDEAEEIRTRVEDLIAKWEKSIKLELQQRSTWCSSAKRENFIHFTLSCFNYYTRI
jgi:hypothetical protein